MKATFNLCADYMCTYVRLWSNVNISQMFQIHSLKFYGALAAIIPEVVMASFHPVVNIQGKKPLLMMATSLGLLTSLWNGTLCHSVLQHQRPLTANRVLLLNVLVTHICDMVMLYISFILEIALPENGNMNGTAVIGRDERCNYINRLNVARSLGVPLKTATHCATNTLASAICLYISSLHFERRAGQQGVTKSRAWDIVAVSWVLSIAMMFYPMVAGCSGERIFHVVLYSWLAYVLLALGLTVFFSIAACARPFCSTYRLIGVRSGLQGVFLLLQVLLLTVTLLPLPVHELLVLFRSSDHHAMAEHIERDRARRTSFQCLPFLFYMISPILMLAASSDTRKEITEIRRISTTKVSFNDSVEVNRYSRDSLETMKLSETSPRPRARSSFCQFWCIIFD